MLHFTLFILEKRYTKLTKTKKYLEKTLKTWKNHGILLVSRSANPVSVGWHEAKNHEPLTSKLCQVDVQCESDDECEETLILNGSIYTEVIDHLINDWLSQWWSILWPRFENNPSSDLLLQKWESFNFHHIHGVTDVAQEKEKPWSHDHVIPPWEGRNAG